MERTESLNTFVIDMAQEKGNQFRLNGEPIDISKVQTMDIHIESGSIQIRTVEIKHMKLGNAGL